MIFSLSPLDVSCKIWYKRYRKQVNSMAKKPKKKPTTYEIAELILKAVTAIATLISAIKWW